MYPLHVHIPSRPHCCWMSSDRLSHRWEIINKKKITTRPLTHHSLFDNSRLLKTLQWFSTPYSPDLPPLRLSPIPQDEITERAFLTRLTRSTQKRKRLSTHSNLRTSRDALNHGKHAGIAVCMPKGTTSKETVETRSYGKKPFFMVKFPEFLGRPTYSIHHCCHAKRTRNVKTEGAL
jgi:hypothetical protein